MWYFFSCLHDGVARCDPASPRAAVVPPVAAQPGQAAITAAAAPADSFGERETFRGRGGLEPPDVAGLGRRAGSAGMLCSQRQTPGRGCPWRQPGERWLWSRGMRGPEERCDTRCAGSTSRSTRWWRLRRRSCSKGSLTLSGGRGRAAAFTCPALVQRAHLRTSALVETWPKLFWGVLLLVT